MALSEQERQQIIDMADLAVRRYFDHYLQNVYPEQAKSLRHHAHITVEKHDGDREAHGGVEKKFNRAKWMIAGIVALGSACGSFIVPFVKSIFGGG